MDARGQPTSRGGLKTKAEHQSLGKQKGIEFTPAVAGATE